MLGGFLKQAATGESKHSAAEARPGHQAVPFCLSLNVHRSPIGILISGAAPNYGIIRAQET